MIVPPPFMVSVPESTRNARLLMFDPEFTVIVLPFVSIVRLLSILKPSSLVISFKTVIAAPSEAPEMAAASVSYAVSVSGI